MVLRLNRTTNLGRLVLIFCITIFFTSISKVSFALPDDGPVKLAVVNSYDAGISAKHFSNTVAAIRAAIAPRRLEVHFYDQDDFLKGCRREEIRSFNCLEWLNRYDEGLQRRNLSSNCYQ